MIEKGDHIVLWKENWMKLIKIDSKTKKVSGIGVIDTSKFIGEEWGNEIKLGKSDYRLLKPALKDMPDLFNRKAQVVLPRVASQIVMYCNLSNGKKVIEGGAGSGFLSAILTRAVSPDGEVITYEIRDDFMRTAEKNLESFGLTENWTVKKGDVTKDVQEEDVDAFILDIPEPWKALDMADKALNEGGVFCSYLPSTNQLEKIVVEMRNRGYIDVKSFETLEREMVVKEGAVRPSYDMLGHTGYVTVGIKTP